MSKFKGFSTVELTRPKKSYFDLSHQVRATAIMGQLHPIMVKEAIPGDVFRGSSEVLLRLAPLLAPIYDQIQLYVHFFFVPNRLLWDEWEEFITGGRLGAEASPEAAPIPPYVRIHKMIEQVVDGKGSLGDHMGLPIFQEFGNAAAWEAVGLGASIDAMPFLAFQKVYMDYYRDRNFVPDDLMEFPVPSGELDLDTGEALEFLQNRMRNWPHDYFTSALPFTQRGAEVLIPVDAAVSYLQQSRVVSSTTGNLITNNDAMGLGTEDTPTYPPGSMMWSATPGGGVDDIPVRVENIDSISNTTSTIGDFRSAYALQVWLERNAIGGSRYTESTQAHFGVRPQDERLQRAEYLGGGRIKVQISEVVSTAYSNDGEATVPLANMAGHGITYGNTNRFNYFCPEHGIVIGIMSLLAPASYHQGLDPMWRRKSFLSYPWPTFAALGEQRVNKNELYCSPENMTLDADGEYPLFGYQSRYVEWKNAINRNTGDFHDTLLFWTLTRDFGGTSPVLGQEFNEWSGQESRLFAVQDGTPPFWCYIHNKLGVTRCLPYFGKPNTLGFGSY